MPAHKIKSISGEGRKDACKHASRPGISRAGPLSCTLRAARGPGQMSSGHQWTHQSTRMTRPVPTLTRINSPGDHLLGNSNIWSNQQSSASGKMCTLIRPPLAFSHLSQSPRSHFVSWQFAPLSTFPSCSSTVSSLHPLLPCSDVFATLGSSLCWICHLSLFFTSLNTVFLPT